MQTIEHPRLIQSLLSSTRKIAIVDDDEQAREVISLQVENTEGFEPILIYPHDEYSSDVNKFADYIDSQEVYAVICDHRLRPLGFADFYGAELVAALYDKKIPAILVTQFFYPDLNVSIRKYIDKIPVLIERGNINSTEITKGIEYCYSELNTGFSLSRKPYNTLVEIESMNYEDGESVIDAIIPSWDYDTAIRFPTAIIPETLHQSLEKDTLLFADVNIGAETYDKIYLKNFELAPDPRGIDINDLIT
jgi:CheY-like chemotaxis protein